MQELVGDPLPIGVEANRKALEVVAKDAYDQRILPRPLLIWVGVAGLVLGGATLGVIGWADDHYGSSAIARTMGLTTFALSDVVFSLCTRDEQRSVFSLGVLEDRIFLYCTGGSIAAIVLGTELGIFERVLGTVHLTGHQWLVCIVVGLAIIPVSEARRLLLQRRRPAVADEPQDARPAASTSP